MEVYLDKRSVKQIQLSAADAIDEGDTETLKEDILESFPEEMLDGIEQHLGGTDLMDMLGEILEEWSGDQIEELLDLRHVSSSRLSMSEAVRRVKGNGCPCSFR